MTDRDKLIELIQKWYENLEMFPYLADYLLANGVIVPPCKVGDMVYQTDGVRMYESTIKKIVYDAHIISFDKDAIGKTIFLTKEDAEKELKRRSEGNA